MNFEKRSQNRDSRKKNLKPQMFRATFSSKLTPLNTLALCSILAVPSALADDAPINDLLNLMTQKGMLTQEEAAKLKAEADASQTNGVPGYGSKWKISDSIKDIELYGDLKFRYESRDTRNPVNENIDQDRFRYAFRLGLRGNALDNFYYGLQLETSANPRSTWVTFGSTSTSATALSPSTKSGAGVNLGRIYLGWKPWEGADITVGKFANPLYTTSLVWDPDISPEGASEKFKHSVGKADLFVNFGQFIYRDVNPSRADPGFLPSAPLGESGSVPLLLAWQGGFEYHFTTNISFKAAGTLYNYTSHAVNNRPLNPLTPGAGFSDVYVGEGLNGANEYNNFNSYAADGFNYNQTGINDLLVLDIPFEVDFKISKLNAKVFGDFAENLDGSSRANAAAQALSSPYYTQVNNAYLPAPVIPAFPNDNKAYQFGVAVGNSRVLGSPSKKGDWEIKAYWQHMEQYALDPNLIDSDFFEGRENMEGYYAAISYNLTQGMSGTVRYGYARRINNQLGTGGSNLDAPWMNPIQKYQIFQVDLSYKF